MRAPGVGDLGGARAAEIDAVGVRRAEKLWNWSTRAGPRRLLPNIDSGFILGEGGGFAPKARVRERVVRVAMVDCSGLLDKVGVRIYCQDRVNSE
jgi:hypothetical protein